MSPRQVPHDLDVEAGLLGVMILSPGARAQAYGMLVADDFYKPAHRLLFAAIGAVEHRGEAVDTTTVADQLRRDGLLGTVGGPAGLIELNAKAPAFDRASSYARIVVDDANLRRLIALGDEIAEIGYKGPEDVGAAVEHAQAMLAEVAARTQGRRRAITTTVSNVEAEQVDFLWAGRIPRGKVTVLDGDPGLGKSTVALDIAARVSTGSPMPECTERREPAGVVLLSAEDGIGDTIRPRLEAAGADCHRIVVLAGVLGVGGPPRLPSLPGDTSELGRVVAETGAALIVIDPLMAYLDRQVDSYRDQDVRGALHRLARLAETSGAAVLIIRHLNKSAGGSALYRGGGSIGIIGAARSGLLVGTDPEDERRRVLAVNKANLAEKLEALAYRLVPDDKWGCVRVCWEGPTGYRAEQLVGLHSDAEQEAAGALADACDLLQEVLGDGPRWVAHVRDEARAASVAWRTVVRAKAYLHVLSAKIGKPGDSEQGWQWYLPKDAK
jgi:RecA/RadA recombinase